ncbi:MAG: TetR/AcrR family transcriptional regulator [Hyphomicrobium sp.]|uniref:TetR/AcrR family transcriptional regulator n=1 Tax=Hyphomicrobium sp. TaxID=82 RepID=UPI0035666390
MTNRSQMPRRIGGQTRLHLPAAERERQIVEAAAQFFAENGFEGQTRELAKTMGITHSAIFRYFPTKDALIERVYEHVFVARWDASWKTLICDRSQSIEARLIRFYTEYADRIFDPCWMRIFMFAGLKGHPMTHRYVSLIRNQLIKPCCNELRAELRLPPISSAAMTPREEEAFWGLHGAVFYFGIRTFIYEVRTSPNRAEVIRDQVQMFLAGVPPILRAALIESK